MHFSKLRSISVDKILGLSSILMTLIFGLWGIFLTTSSNELNEKMYQLSRSQLKLSEKQDSTSINIDQFSLLLGKTDTVIRELTNQLSLLEKQQKTANENAQLEHLSNEGNFYFSAQRLDMTLIEVVNHTSNLLNLNLEERAVFLEKVDAILSTQLNNRFLASQKYMFRDWIAVHDTIQQYKLEVEKSVYYPKETVEIQNKVWLNAFFSVVALSKNTNVYMKYYRSTKPKVHRADDYLKIVKLNSKND